MLTVACNSSSIASSCPCANRTLFAYCSSVQYIRLWRFFEMSQNCQRVPNHCRKHSHFSPTERMKACSLLNHTSVGSYEAEEYTRRVLKWTMPEWFWRKFVIWKMNGRKWGWARAKIIKSKIRIHCKSFPTFYSLRFVPQDKSPPHRIAMRMWIAWFRRKQKTKLYHRFKKLHPITL